MTGDSEIDSCRNQRFSAFPQYPDRLWLKLSLLFYGYLESSACEEVVAVYPVSKQ